MKMKLIIAALAFSFAGAAFAIDRAELDNRIQLLADKFDALEHQPGQAIPAETLRRAQGIMLLNRTKAGFLFAYQGGAGVAMVRDGKGGKWGPVTFVSANEASLGLQAGGEQHFVVVLFMTTNATRLLTDPKFDFAAEARATADNNVAGVETGQPPGPLVLVYDDRQGLYAGAAVKGGAVSPDDDANRAYYGDYRARETFYSAIASRPRRRRPAWPTKFSSSRKATRPTARIGVRHSFALGAGGGSTTCGWAMTYLPASPVTTNWPRMIW